MAKFTNFPITVNCNSNSSIKNLPNTLTIICICYVYLKEFDYNGKLQQDECEKKYLCDNGIAYPIDLIDNNYN